MQIKLRVLDEIVLANFKNLFTIDGNAKQNAVPIIWATDERAESWAYSPLLDKEDFVDPVTKIRLPYMNLFRYKITKSNPNYHLEVNYTLNSWTMYEEEANQILEQILSKFNPTLTLWNHEGDEIIGNMRLNSICSNLNDKGPNRILKWSLDMTAALWPTWPKSKPEPQPESPKPTAVEALPGTQNLGEVDDVEYFKKIKFHT
jgi:hypothetical protein